MMAVIMNVQPLTLACVNSRAISYYYVVLKAFDILSILAHSELLLQYQLKAHSMPLFLHVRYN